VEVVTLPLEVVVLVGLEDSSSLDRKKEFDSIDERVTLEMLNNKKELNMKSEKSKNTRHATFNIRRNDEAKRAGINRLAITTLSDNWRISDTTINMTLRDARALRDFLNKNLD